MVNKLKLAMFRELEAERDKARTWAARWKRAAKDWKENAYLSEDRVEVWRKKADDRRLALADIEAERDRLEEQLAEELRRRAELERELRLNASMLARQCDLAREAETERDELKQKLEMCQAEAATMRKILEKIAYSNIGYEAGVLAREALSSTAGADFLDRMRKLEACQAEAASWKVKYQTLVARLTK